MDEIRKDSVFLRFANRKLASQRRFFKLLFSGQEMVADHFHSTNNGDIVYHTMTAIAPLNHRQVAFPIMVTKAFIYCNKTQAVAVLSLTGNTKLPGDSAKRMV